MKKDQLKIESISMWLDDEPLSNKEIANTLRTTQKVSSIIQDIILNKTLRTINIESSVEQKTLKDYRETNNLTTDNVYNEFLRSNHLNEELLIWVICRPIRIVIFREERWGPRINSLYLKHKDKFDTVQYKCLQNEDQDLMQEVFFRLKDKEESWETMSKQFSVGKENNYGRVGPLPVNSIKPKLLNALREHGPNKIIRPMYLDGKFTVAALEGFYPSKLDDNLKVEILKVEFEEWLNEETNRMLGKVRFTK